MAHTKCERLRNSDSRNTSTLVLQRIYGFGLNLAAMAESKGVGTDSDAENEMRYSPKRVMATVTFKGQA